jgi:zinc protease
MRYLLAMFSRLKSYAYIAVLISSLASLPIYAEAFSSPIPTIPYIKEKLSNGLTVIISEDHTSPVAFVEVTYRVGSSKEDPGKTGFAHFFEHMMFSGSAHVKNGEHFKRITQAGGRLNGTTGRDFTNYYETMPSNQLETALWLEADRMGFLLGNVTQQAFEVQRATVKNEKAQHYDNQPYGMSYEISAKNLYPSWHPYSWIPIGVVEDLDRVSVEDLRQFFLKWYSPNNAVLTVCGDVSPNQVLMWAEKYFGTLPNGPKPDPTFYPQPQLSKTVYVTLEDHFIRQPKLEITWIGTPSFHNNEPALDAVSFMLGRGINSLLYQKLVKTQRVFSAEAYHSTGELSGEFQIEILGYPDQSLKEIKKEIDAILSSFEKSIREEDLNRFKSWAVGSLLFKLDTAEEKGRQLAMGEILTGNPNQNLFQLKRYQKLTLRDVKKAYKKYLASKPSLILSIVPAGKTTLQAGKPSSPKWTGADKPLTGKKTELRTYNPPKDSFDRAQPPVIKDPTTPSLPAFWTATLNNGIRIMGFTLSELPFAKLELELPAGQLENPVSKSGLSTLTSVLMNQGSTSRSAEAFTKQLELLGAQLAFSSSETGTTLYLQSLADDFPQALDFFKERLFSAVFTPDEFNRFKKEQLEQIAYNDKIPVFRARSAFRRLVYGDQHPLSVLPLGLKDNVDHLSSEDVVSFFKAHYGPKQAFLRYVGPHEKEVVLDNLSALQSWVAPSQTPKITTVTETPATPCIYIMDHPNAPQSVIRMGYLAFPYDSTGQFFNAGIMNFPLGEAFNSRLNLRLREDKAYTYGIGSYFSGSEVKGPFFISTSVKAEHTGDAIELILNEIRSYKNTGPTRAETAFTRDSLIQRMALSLENSAELLDMAASLQRYKLPLDFLSQQRIILNGLAPEQLKNWANNFLPIESFIIVIVGDKTTILPQLANKDIPQKIIFVE